MLRKIACCKNAKVLAKKQQNTIKGGGIIIEDISIS